MGNFDEMYRVVQVDRTRKDQSVEGFNKDLEKEKDIIGTPRWEKIQIDLKEKLDREQKSIRDKSLNRIDLYYSESEKAIKNHYQKEPTQGMVNTIALLRDRKNVPVSEIKALMEKYHDCLPAVLALAEVAEEHGYIVTQPLTIDHMMHALDVVASNFRYFINAYDGSDKAKQTPSLMNLERFFRSETGYDFTDVKSSAEARLAFWNEFVGYGYPEMFDSDSLKARNVTVCLYFADLDEMLAYIESNTKGLTGQAKENKINKILGECPAIYGAIYRSYKATGEKHPLLERGELLNEFGEVKRLK